MHKIFILNKHDNRALWPNCKIFSVDRSSPIGNPFFMDGEKDRDRVCDAYEKYFREMLDEGANKAFNSYVADIVAAAKEGDVGLACWCHPKRCHAETVRSYAQAKIEADLVTQ